MNKINLGKVCVTPRGDYRTENTYEVLDIVIYLGNTYVCINPMLPITDENGWMVIARTNGIIGEDGSDGEPGKSAYELAVIAGFNGTITEWLAQIKGEKGDKGDAGTESTVNGKPIVSIVGGDNITITETDTTITINGMNGDVTKAYVDTQDGTKVDKIAGKALSTNDYTTEEKTKLSGVEANANNYNDSKVVADIARVEAIAAGRSRARVFNGLADIKSWIALPENVEIIKIGDQFLTRELGVPDYWWDGAELQILETEKVDLTEYIEYSDIVDNLTTDNDKLVLSAKQGKILDNKLNENIVDSWRIVHDDPKSFGVFEYYGINLQSGSPVMYIHDKEIHTATDVKHGLFSSADKRKLDAIEHLAEVNVIESISVDSTTLPITNKSVNISLKNKVDKISNILADVIGYVPVVAKVKTQQPNFDTFIEPGTYFINENDVLSWPANLVFHWGVLSVIYGGGDDITKCIVQTYYSNQNAGPRPKYRVKWSTGNWTEWQEYGITDARVIDKINQETVKLINGGVYYTLFLLPNTATSTDIVSTWSNIDNYKAVFKNNLNTPGPHIIQIVATRTVNGTVFREVIPVNVHREIKSDSIIEYTVSFVDGVVVDNTASSILRVCILTETTTNSVISLSLKNYSSETSSTKISKMFDDIDERIDAIDAELNAFDATNITSGVIDVSRLPKSAIERLTVVATDVDRFALTLTTAQKGDTVKVTSTGQMYFIVDDTKLSTEAGYEPYTATVASSVAWSGITSKPTTISGYGITDGVTKVAGKELSTNDYTTEEKTKLTDIENNANNYSHPGYSSAESNLYKVTVDTHGHVVDATEVVAADILALGVAQTGPTGAAGERGPVGPPGATGSQGPKGNDGDTPSITGDLITAPLNALPITNYNIKYTYSTTSAVGLSFNGTPLEGSEFAISIKNNTGSSITQPIPNGSGWQTEAASFVIPSGKVGEIFIKYVHGTYIVRI